VIDVKRLVLGMLLVVLLATPALAAGGGQRARSYRLAPAGQVFPCDPYDNGWQIYGASGKIVVNQPARGIGLNLTVVIEGCEPGRLYRVDESGSLTWGQYVPGNYWWKPLGFIAADETGAGSLHIQRLSAELPEGPWTMSIWVNREDVNKTILISEPFLVVGR
jgi:hypothetical protein